MSSIKKELEQHVLLVSIMLFLIVTKFLLVPVIEWQNSIIASNAILSKKLSKEQSVLKREKNNVELSQLLDEVLLDANKAVFPMAQEVTFKLDTQQLLEQKLTVGGLSLDRISWQPAIFFEDAKLRKYLIDAQVSGDTLKLIEFLVGIDQHAQLGVSKFNIDVRGATSSLGTSRARITFYLYARVEQ
ncbi:hypothetical protein [Pseudoalteromonas sp. MMG012]|uniref:hypothetical protein n=1 Tax=Pseudoalteromonas sp. MMG012 TaxID=2822686 RepID=UPI001B3A64D9|nr:hypothetical protein [Pseudoalteromonas sp. MMG012]MBQ4849237.1 hypothetical protein [Pseudoalteromonas sp. MMG012]